MWVGAQKNTQTPRQRGAGEGSRAPPPKASTTLAEGPRVPAALVKARMIHQPNGVTKSAHRGRIAMRLAVKWTTFSVFAFLCVVSGFAQGRDSACTPSFPLRPPWLGDDAASSIPLPDGRDVWIFGDTLYGDQRVVTGEVPAMVHNSLGISRCENGQWNLDYAIKRDAKGNFDTFFKPQQN